MGCRDKGLVAHQSQTNKTMLVNKQEHCPIIPEPEPSTTTEAATTTQIIMEEDTTIDFIMDESSGNEELFIYPDVPISFSTEPTTTTTNCPTCQCNCPTAPPPEVPEENVPDYDIGTDVFL